MLSMDDRVQAVRKALRQFPDFPKRGINFWDIFSLMKQPTVFQDCIDIFVEHIKEKHRDVDVIIGLDARGFIFGPLIALKLNKPFAPIRKKGKLPGETAQVTYTLEYGSDVFEAQVDAVQAGQKVIIVDDLLATGGTMDAACQLMTSLSATVLECVVMIELQDLQGRQKVAAPLFSLIQG